MIVVTSEDKECISLKQHSETHQEQVGYSIEGLELPVVWIDLEEQIGQTARKGEQAKDISPVVVESMVSMN